MSEVQQVYKFSRWILKGDSRLDPASWPKGSRATSRCRHEEMELDLEQDEWSFSGLPKLPFREGA